MNCTTTKRVLCFDWNRNRWTHPKDSRLLLRALQFFDELTRCRIEWLCIWRMELDYEEVT